MPFTKRTIQIELDASIDLTGATLMQIRYIKPISKTKGAWVADGAVGQTVWVKIPKTEITERGDWRMQVYIEFGADAYSGEFEIITFIDPIEIV